MKSDFESRLAALAGEENLNAAKQLLKLGTPLTGVWRDGRGVLHGCFLEHGRRAEVSVMTGDEPQSDCSCEDTGFCRHAAALVMYSGRFRVQPPPPEEQPFYLSGLRKEELPRLIEAAQPPVASLTIQAQSAFPHVPSKWEHLVMRITLKGRGREYVGNLNNLRKLYFDKSLGAVLQWEDFPLQERQIIRFLSLYSEADGSNLLLDAEYTAEFFHSLGGFEGFFRNGKRLMIRTERAEAVLLRHRNRYLPGLRFGGAVIPAVDTKVITGRSGCWVGRGGEYFFVPAAGDVGYIRSFFRSKGWTPEGIAAEADMIRGFQLPVIKVDRDDPATGVSGGVRLEAVMDREAGELTLDIGYIYDCGDNSSSAFAPRSGTLVFSGRQVFQRDTVFERHFESALELFGFTVSRGRAVLRGMESIGLWLDRGLPGLAENFQLLLSPGISRLSGGMTGVPELSLHCRCIESNAAGYLLEYALGSSGVMAEWQEAVDGAAAGNIYLPLAGGVAKVPPLIGRFLRAAKRIVREPDDIGRRFTVPYCNAAYFVKMLQDVPGAVPPELAAAVVVVDQAPLPVFESSFKFNGTLRKYQEEGVAFMQFMTDRGFNCLLADEMGLGKTVQMLALLSSRRRKGDAPILLVCPASLTANWQREANRFVPDMKVAVPAGNERSRILASAGDYDMIILSYAAARLSRDHLKKITFSFLILDEAQHIKNPASGNAKNCKVLKAGHRIVLTGTPLENSPEDLWSVMDFLQPGMLGTLAEFRRTYAGLAEDPELQQDLAARVSPFIKRRTKSEVASDLPSRTELTIYCTLPPEQRKLYEEVLQQGRRELSDCEAAGGKDASRIFTTLLRLRQICCHPALLPDGAGENVPSAKTDLLNELLDENIDSSHRLLLFSQFTSLLHLLEPELRTKNIPYEYLDGATRNRQERVDRFNQDPEIPVFLLSLKAGGTGLNLTGADTVVIYDPWWNPAVELQAADRTHRIGQTRPVTVIRLVVKDSVEERILDLQQRKRQVFDALVAEPGAGGGLSLEDLRELLA